MMSGVARTDQSVIGRWWWTIDRWTLAALVLLIALGILLIQAATPAVAVRHELGTFYFVERHLMMLVPALVLLIGTSLLSPKNIRYLSSLLFAAMIPLLAITPFFGVEIKGAVRWIQVMGFSFQPSELVKPFFAIVTAWLLTRHCERKPFPAFGSSAALYALVVLLLLAQPDIGMTLLVSAIWFGQFFLAGMPVVLVAALPFMLTVALLGAYYAFPHFASRFDRFISNSGDTYQTDKAIEAFSNGGLFGTGPGAGTVKMSIPDAHADFIFAVAGEELGFLGALFIVSLFAFIIFRCAHKLRREKNLFILLASSGLLIEFGIQMAINLGSTLRLIPAKGMTLPFISYGGSSLWSSALLMGMLLALTRKRYSQSDT